VNSRIERIKELHGRSLNEVNEMRTRGQLSTREWEGFVFLWLWVEPRHHVKHKEFEERCGVEAYWRRINRVRGLLGLVPYIKLSSWDEASNF
jgi:hypothetical protein